LAQLFDRAGHVDADLAIARRSYPHEDAQEPGPGFEAIEIRPVD
jgi:hypothetical protein